jgi:hypothetical protein
VRDGTSPLRFTQQPSFWFLCGAIFLANAALSVVWTEWALAALQGVTGAMAMAAAGTSWQHRRAGGRGGGGSRRA